MIFGNLVIGRAETTIADKCCTSDFLVKLASHLALDPCDDVEICDVGHIVTIQLLFLINSLRIGSSLQQREDLLFLEVTLHVASSAGFVLGEVSEHRFDPAERCVVSAVENDIDPIGISLDPFRLSAQCLILREEHVRIAESVSLICCGLGRTSHARCRNRAGKSVYKCAIADHVLDCFFKRSAALCILQNTLHIGVAQELCCGTGLSVKYVVLHIIISFVIAVFHLFVVLIFVRAALSVLDCHADHGINRSLLLFCEGVEYFFDCLVVASAGLFICHFDVFLLFRFFSVIQFKLFTGVDDSLVVRLIAVNQNRIDQSARVSSSKYQTHFADYAVHDIPADLLELVCINRKTGNVAVLYYKLGVTSCRCVVE